MEKASLFVLSVLSLIFFGCTDQGDVADSGQRVLVIGALVPLTGAGASPGESAQAGLGYAMNQVTDYLERTQRDVVVEVKIEDTGTDTTMALQAYERLREEGVRIIIGPYSSAVLAALKSTADRDGILLVSPGSVASSLAVAGDNIFRLLPDVTSQGEALAALIIDDGIRLLLPIVRRDIWGQELLEATTTALEGSGVLIGAPVEYDPTTTDYQMPFLEFSDRLDQALTTYEYAEAGAYMLSYGEGYEWLSRATDVIDPLVRWYGSSAFAESSTLLDDAQVGAFADTAALACPAFGLDPNARTLWRPMLEDLQNSLGRMPEVFAFTSRDALWLAVDVLLEASLDASPDELKEILLQRASSSYGATGWLGLNAFGDRSWAMYEFWGVRESSGDVEWEVQAVYNNETGELFRK